jgi:hypothetical protein
MFRDRRTSPVTSPEIDWSYDIRGLEGWYWVQPDYPAEIKLELPEGMWPNGLTVFYQPDAPERLTYHFALDESTPGCGQGEGELDQPCDPSAEDGAILVTLMVYAVAPFVAAALVIYVMLAFVLGS